MSFSREPPAQRLSQQPSQEPAPSPSPFDGRRWRHRQPSARQRSLAAVARETLDVLPGILKELPELRADESVVYDLYSSLARLDPALCPKLPAKARINVVNDDSFNVAIEMDARRRECAVPGRVAVLNMASNKSPGGGWLSGASAQEEALCYRSSLALSLHRRDYPLRSGQGIYTRDVVIIRGAMDRGHALTLGSSSSPAARPAELPVVSVLSVPALRRPEKIATVVDVGEAEKEDEARTNERLARHESSRRPGRQQQQQGQQKTEESFARPGDRELTRHKMRLALRMAATNGHRALVLGALGCGAFRNPVREVARCWREVLAEPEFAGGWWDEICFAVYDRRGEGNFDVFRELLEGQEV